MDLGLRDKVYLVTGGSRGLGFATAQALVADGARVVLSARHEASAAAARLAHDVSSGGGGTAASPGKSAAMTNGGANAPITGVTVSGAAGGLAEITADSTPDSAAGIPATAAATQPRKALSRGSRRTTRIRPRLAGWLTPRGTGSAAWTVR